MTGLLVVCALDEGEGRLSRTLAAGYPKRPILDGASDVHPIIGETEEHRAGETPAKGALDLPLEHLAFALLAFADGVEAEFGKNEGLAVREHLETGEVVLEWLALVQIDVERQEIDILRAEKLRG